MMSAAVLPKVGSKSEYVAVYANDGVWLPAVRAICGRHGLSGADLRRQVLGTHVVYRTGELIVKLFCPFWQDDFAAERAALLGLRDLPIPKLVETGELESWPYVILTALPGFPAAGVWPTLDPVEKGRVVQDVGRFMRRLHRQPRIPGLPGDWDSFVSERVAQLDDHHQPAEPWRAWLHAKVAALPRRRRDLVTLNSDLTDDHVLLSEAAGRWSVSGIIDFGDALTGDALYEFPAPLLCFAGGQPALARALLEAYGERMTPELADEILTYCLLHKYVRLSDMVARAKATSPESLLEAMWGTFRL